MTRIEPGKQYGIIKVVKAKNDPDDKLKTWVCICGKCGNEFHYVGANVFKYQNDGCFACRAKERELARIEDAKKYNGMIFGDLKILEYSHISKRGTIMVRTKCLKCGSETNMQLGRIINGIVTQCVYCARNNLEPWNECLKKYYVDGTCLVNIDGRRKTNKNSSTGATGVSYMKKEKKYRAYINFKRKQYSLGLYDNIDDAIAARKEAEKQVYGSFLDWYKTAYEEKEKPKS